MSDPICILKTLYRIVLKFAAYPLLTGVATAQSVPNKSLDYKIPAAVVAAENNLNAAALLADALERKISEHFAEFTPEVYRYRKVPGISAATILGDGSVVFIIDVGAMPRIQRAQAASATALAGASRMDPITA